MRIKAAEFCLKQIINFQQFQLIRLMNKRERVWWMYWLTENPAAFRHWMLSVLELAKLKKQFEEQYFPDIDPNHPRNFQNCEQGFAAQKTFQKQVNSLVKAIPRMGNPFWMIFQN